LDETEEFKAGEESAGKSVGGASPQNFKRYSTNSRAVGTAGKKIMTPSRIKTNTRFSASGVSEKKVPKTPTSGPRLS
jgi:hypothetical protein